MKCSIAAFEEFKKSAIWEDMREVMGRMNSDIVASQISSPGDSDNMEKITIDNLLNRGRLDAMSKMAVLPDICIEEIELEREEANHAKRSERDE